MCQEDIAVKAVCVFGGSEEKGAFRGAGRGKEMSRKIDRTPDRGCYCKFLPFNRASQVGFTHLLGDKREVCCSALPMQHSAEELQALESRPRCLYHSSYELQQFIV